MKDKLFTYFKNVCQVFLSILEGWFFLWWFLYAWFFITDRKDQESIELGIPLGWTMVVIGVIVIFAIEFSMYHRNKNWKKYLLFSLLPCISSSLITFLYLCLQ